MEQMHRSADSELPEPDIHKPQHAGGSPRHDHVTFQRLDLTYTNLVLPISFLGIIVLGIIFVLVVLVLWWRNFAPTWKLKKKRSDSLLKTMAFSDDSRSFRVEIVRDAPRIVTNDSDLSEEDRASVKYVEERERKLTVVTTRNYGGSSPKIPEDEKKSNETPKFVFPPESDAGPSRSEPLEADTPKLKIPLPEQTWLTHKKPFECKTYRATIPRQLAEVVRTELGDDLLEIRSKKFSATRSPSLEKDDKSPFVGIACDRNEVFGFEPEEIRQISGSPVVEVRVQPQNEQRFSIVDKNFNNNVTPVSPKLPENRRNNTEHVRTSSLDVSNENRSSNLRRFRSVNTKLNICSAADISNMETQQERSQMQNSPRILECSSANEKSSCSKFNFSPKLLGDNQNSPKFFTPTDKFSPRFFAESSPKSVYYDSVRSPKFFPDTPKSPGTNDERKSLSPKAFTEHRNSRNNSPKLFCDQLSPRILAGKPRSPKIHSGNKENYFDFDSSTAKNVEFARQNSLDEVDNASSVLKKPNYIQRYAGRKSIERERVTQTEKLDVRRYKRHNSCDTYNRNFENGNDYSRTNLEPVRNDNEKPIGDLEKMQVDPDKGEDVLDCCVHIEAMRISPKTPDEKFEKADTLQPPHPHTAQERRQRLKSISLDSDNARIIEHNLGLPIAKHMKHDNLNEALQDYSSSCCNVKRSGTCDPGQTKFKFDHVEISQVESKDFYVEESKYSPDIGAQKKCLRDSSNTKSFIDMPRFSPKEFEVTITVEEDPSADTNQKRKGNKNLRNLTIDLTRRDSDLEKELLEFEKLYTDSEEKKVKTPTLKIKATSLDSSESINLSLPQKKTLEVPQNSVSVPNTPKRQLKRILAQRSLAKPQEMHSGGKMGYNSLQCDQRRFNKWQPVFLDSGIFLKENHANLMLYQPGTSRASSRRMGSFDESMADFAEHPPEINICNDCDTSSGSQSLGSNLGSFKPNLSVSSTNLKTLPEGVPSNDFEPTADEKISKKVLYRRGSNQSLKISLDYGQPSCSKYSTLSLQSSNCSINSVGLSCHNLSSIRNSASNFSLNTDNRQKKMLERRNSNQSLTLNTGLLTPITRVIGSSNANLQSSNTNLSETQCQPLKNCLLQRRGSNNSLTLNIQNSNTNLARFSSNSSLNINKDIKTGQRKGLLERRSSNTSLTLNINSSNPQLTTSRGLSISNYNLNGSTCNLSLHNSNQSINTEHKKGILERRSSNTSLTINIQNQEVPRDIEVDEKVLESNLKDPQFMQQKDKHRKSLSTENLIPKSYKNRIHTMKKNENQCMSFGSHDDLWSNSYAESEAFQEYGQNLTYVCGDPENEIIYAFGTRQNFDESEGAIRNITTKPLSPQTTSEDFKAYLANIQHLQNATSVLTRKQLKDLNNVFQNGYSKVKCKGSDENGHRCSPRGDISKDNPQMAFPETEMPCSEYQKTMLRNLHKEFWDLPSNFQEKPMVFGSHPKNRYKTILPNEHSRFILKPEGADSSEGYVNANFIKGHEYTKNSYIATQGPLQNTIYDFWLMVHQNAANFPANTDPDSGSLKSDSPIQKIVMLTNFIENNRQKCEKYFPLEIDEEVVFENPDIDAGIFADSPKNVDVRNRFTIKNKGIIKKTGYTIRRLLVSYRKGSVEVTGERKGSSEDTGKSQKLNEVADECCKESSEGTGKSDKGSNETGESQGSNDEIGEIGQSDSIGESCKGSSYLTGETDGSSVIENVTKIHETVVYHYWFHNWADHKCPKDVNALLNLSLDVLKSGPDDFENDTNDSKDCEPMTKFVFPPLSPLESCSKGTKSLDFDDTSPPTIVHCSAGIGRTGCLIAILNGIKQMSYDQKVDILGIVCNMRLNRGGMVQNSEQYELIHKVLCLYEQICMPNL